MRLLMVCICFLRTQQRAKSQCIKHIPPSVGWSFAGLVHHGDLLSQGHSFLWEGCSSRGLQLVWSFGARVAVSHQRRV